MVVQEIMGSGIAFLLLVLLMLLLLLTLAVHADVPFR
jgi:hypothetical protein